MRWDRQERVEALLGERWVCGRGARTWRRSRSGRSRRRSLTGNEDYELWVKRGGMGICKVHGDRRRSSADVKQTLWKPWLFEAYFNAEVTAYARDTTFKELLFH